MKTKYNKRKYKMQSGVQQIQMDTPDYSESYRILSEANAKQQMGGGLVRTGLDIAGTAIGVPGLGGIAEGASSLTDSLLTDAKGNYRNKGFEMLSGVINPFKTATTALSALTGDKGAAAELWNRIPLTGAISSIFGLKNPFGKTNSEKAKEEAKKEEERKERSNRIAAYYGGYKKEASTNAQARMAKKGKYKLLAKEDSRIIEVEGGKKPDGTIRESGGEPIFGPKKSDGTRDLLYLNHSDPTHEAGGVKVAVVPKNKYDSGTSNLMPRRSKVSLLGSGNMAVGARQIKVNELNNTSLSQNLGSMPAVNAANKFVQPMAGKMQVARQIPEYRRKATIKNPMSHKKENPDTNKIVDPPTPIEMRDPITPSGFNKKTLYEAKLPKPVSTHNTKNDYKKGNTYIKTYTEGTSNLEIKKFAPGGDRVKAKATPQEIEAVKRIQRTLGVKDDGIWGPITQKAWERKNNITPKSDSTFTSEDEREARKIFNADFIRAEQERKADSTLYANRIVPTALKAAKANKKVYVTEKRPGRPDTGRKTGNNACLTGVCNVNKMTGTNLPFDMRIAANPNIKGDNPLETRFNPAFQKNSEKLGYKKLKPTDKLQPGDVLQKSVAGVADHARLFLGNRKGPLIGEDHGNDDNMGFEVEDISYLNKMKTVNDAMVGNPGLSAYRYVGLPKRKASMELARTQVKNTKEAIAKKKAEQEKQNLVSTEILPSPDELDFMKKGSKRIKVYR